MIEFKMPYKMHEEEIELIDFQLSTTAVFENVKIAKGKEYNGKILTRNKYIKVPKIRIDSTIEFKSELFNINNHIDYGGIIYCIISKTQGACKAICSVTSSPGFSLKPKGMAYLMFTSFSEFSIQPN